jgi:TolB-like protein
MQSFLDQPSEEYFADGMTELLISELGRLSRSRVISIASVMGFKRSEASYAEIGQALGAELLVDASFMRTEETLRLRVELLEAESKSLLWRESYQRDPSDVYGILADVVT